MARIVITAFVVLPAAIPFSLFWNELFARDALVATIAGVVIVLCLPNRISRSVLALYGFVATASIAYWLRFRGWVNPDIVVAAFRSSPWDIIEFIGMAWQHMLAVIIAGSGMGFILARSRQGYSLPHRSIVLPIAILVFVFFANEYTFPLNWLPRGLAASSQANAAQLPSVTIDASLVETSVLVIGESARADHWHINGYGPETTPLIEAINVLNFSSVRAVGNCTDPVVPALFDLKDATDLAAGRSGTDAVAVFRSAGFLTLLVTGQEMLMDRFDLFDSIFQDTFNAPTTDIDLMPGVDRFLALPNRHKFLVVHLKGSHPRYSRRYPPNEARWHGGVIEEYDNSILATDRFLGALIERLKTLDGRVVMTYVSDHGEGSAQNFEGHCMQPSEFDTRVPAFFWLRGDFEHALLAQLKNNTGADVGQDNILPTLMHLSGISGPTLLREKSLAQSNQHLPVRQVFVSGMLYDCIAGRGCQPAKVGR